MAPRRMTSIVAGCAVMLAACSSGGTIPTTLPADLDPIVFTLGIEDSGNLLRVRLGDEVVPRLPLNGTTDQGWVISVAPDPAILEGGDDLLYFPSEPDQGGMAYHEFDFIAVGLGETTVTLTHGFQVFTFRVQVTADG